MYTEVNDFLSKEDCKHLRTLIDNQHVRSSVASEGREQSVESDFRTSSTSTLDMEDEVVAKLFKKITFDEVISKKLKVMDSTAFTLCRDQGMPIAVLSLFKKNALLNFIHGEEEGTLVTLN